MNKSQITSLMIFCLSFSLYSMEKEIKPIDQTFKTLNIQTLYNKTCDKITQITPTSATAEAILCEILSNVKELNESNIVEYEIGKFAYNQPLSAKNKIYNLTKEPYNGPAYISLFFENIRQYNKHLEKNDFTSPTKEQLFSHKDNLKKLTAIKNAANYGIIVDQELINKAKIFTIIPDTVAILEFEKLIKDIYTMRCTHPDEITLTASIIYDENNSSQ